MRLYLALTVTPEDGERPANSQLILEELESEIENQGIEVEGRVYEVKVLGSGKTPRELTESIGLRRPR